MTFESLLRVRITQEEMRSAQLAAKKEGVSLSQYVRLLLKRRYLVPRLGEVSAEGVSRLGQLYLQLSLLRNDLSKSQDICSSQSLKTIDQLQLLIEQIGSEVRDVRSQILKSGGIE